MRHLENFLSISFFSEGGHAVRHGGRHEGGRGPGAPDALHLRQRGAALHPGEGNGVVLVLVFTAPTLNERKINTWH